MNDVINHFFVFLDGNVALISLFFIVSLNAFFPASLVIIFFVGMYGVLKGSFLAVTVLLLSSTFSYILINKFSLNLADYLTNTKMLRILSKAQLFPVRISFLVRLSSIPYVMQNVACSTLTPSYKQYLAINFVALLPWVTGLGLFAQSIKKLNLGLLITSVLLISFVVFCSKRYEKDFS